MRGWLRVASFANPDEIGSSSGAAVSVAVIIYLASEVGVAVALQSPDASQE